MGRLRISIATKLSILLNHVPNCPYHNTSGIILGITFFFMGNLSTFFCWNNLPILFLEQFIYFFINNLSMCIIIAVVSVPFGVRVQQLGSGKDPDTRLKGGLNTLFLFFFGAWFGVSIYNFFFSSSQIIYENKFAHHF